MKNTTTYNQCNNTDPLSTAVSTATSVTSELCKNVEKKKKKTFFSKVKAIFSRSSTETQKKISEPLHDAVKNTYVIRDNHGTSSNALQIYRQHLDDERNNEKLRIYYGINVNRTGDEIIKNSVLQNDENLFNSNNRTNIDPAHPSPENNGSWITMSTNISHGSETNSRNIFTKQKSLLSPPVDVGIQTKIPSCYKVYLLHKHVSNCNRKIRSNSKPNKKLFRNQNEFEINECNYYDKDSSTQSICTDESHSSKRIHGKCSKKYWKENKRKTNKNFFKKKPRYYDISNIYTEPSQCLGEFTRQSSNLSARTNSNIVIENDERTAFSRTPVSSFTSSSNDSTESPKFKYYKTINLKGTDKKMNKPYMHEGKNAEGSQSKSLPSLNLYRKNKSIKETKCNSSPLVSQNAIQTRIVKKKESIITTYTKNPRINKEIKSTVLHFRNIHENVKNNTKKQPNSTTTSTSTSDSNNSNSAFGIKKKGAITHKFKIKANGKQISRKTKFNALKVQHVNSNCTIMTEELQTKWSTVKNDYSNTNKNYKHVITSKEKNVYQNDIIRTKQNHTREHLIFRNPDKLKSNRRLPIITQPMTFFNENVKSETENEMSKSVISTIYDDKDNVVKDINMDSTNTQQFTNSRGNLIPLKMQNLNSYQVNYNHPIISNTKKYKDNLNSETTKKLKNRKNKETDNSTAIQATNSKNIQNVLSKNNNSPIEIKRDNWASVKENYNKKRNAKLAKQEIPNHIPQIGASDKTFKKKQKKNGIFRKPSSQILKSSNLTEISFECDLQNNQYNTNKQVDKKTQKSWNETHSSNKSSNCETKFNKDSKAIYQNIIMYHDEHEDRLSQKNYLSNVGVHGAFSGNITSKRKTFFAKVTPMHYNK